MRRIYVLAIGTLLTLGALAGTALAKEGAVTKLDALPSGGIHAGQMIPIGFTILMDGVEPYKADVAEIVVRNGTGKVLSYPATPQGPAGHYVANVYFPAAGTYTWQATQGTYFAPFDLGTVAVLGPVTTSETQATPATNPGDQRSHLTGDPLPRRSDRARCERPPRTASPQPPTCLSDGVRNRPSDKGSGALALLPFLIAAVRPCATTLSRRALPPWSPLAPSASSDRSGDTDTAGRSVDLWGSVRTRAPGSARRYRSRGRGPLRCCPRSA